MSDSLRSWLTVLGSGTGVVSPRRAGPALLVGADDCAVLVDCGPGTLIRLSSLGLTPADITAVLFTHFHPDHCGDLAAFLFARRSPELPAARQRVTLVGRGISEHYRNLAAVHGAWVEPREGPPLLLEAGSEPFGVGPWRIRCALPQHIESSVAYRFETSSASLVISGDTGPNNALEELARNADLLVLECSFPDPNPYPTHLSPLSAGALAHAAEARRLLLLHLYPQCESAAVVEGVSARYGGPVMVAEDLACLAW